MTIKTTLALNTEGRAVQIMTAKYGHAIISNAQWGTVEGQFFGFMTFLDRSVNLLKLPCSRVTAIRLREAHATALQDFRARMAAGEWGADRIADTYTQTPAFQNSNPKP